MNENPALETGKEEGITKDEFETKIMMIMMMPNQSDRS
jgi:hypothetical protein